MATTRSPVRPGKPSSNGHGARPSTELRPPGRRLRTPELAIGLLVTTVFALGAVLWHLSAVDKVPALATSTRVERGDVIEADDVHVVYVSSDDDLARLDISQMTRVVGHVAVVDLAEGTLLTASAVAEANAVNSGDGVVGLALDPGAYPARGLAPGDRVNVVRAAEVADLDAEPTIVASNASVFAVEDLSSDRLLVSVLAAEADAAAVAASADAGGLRLVLVAL